MSSNKLQAGIGIAIIVTLLGAGGWYYFNNQTEQITIGGVTLDMPKGATIEVLEDSLPPLDYTVQFEEGVPEGTRSALLGNIKKLTTILEEDPSHFNAWLDLALQYKVAGDYSAAEKVWLYLVDTAPQSGLSAHNLGTLYHLNLKDNEKAEKFFIVAIKREPLQGAYYLSFHELYRYSYKTETTLAADILKEGLKLTPENTDLLLALAVYYRDDKKDKKLAREYYTQARDAVAKTGNTELVRAIETDILRLK
ncbi:MAG: hypothetical protein KBE09_03805 [Candidatus Pacebacteria bacterium]|nr:hypothetical protein [Candidatus Paceibacterota bacterium]